MREIFWLRELISWNLHPRETRKCGFWLKTTSFGALFVVHLALYARLGSPKITISLIIMRTYRALREDLITRMRDHEIYYIDLERIL